MGHDRSYHITLSAGGAERVARDARRVRWGLAPASGRAAVPSLSTFPHLTPALSAPEGGEGDCGHRRMLP